MDIINNYKYKLLTYKNSLSKTRNSQGIGVLHMVTKNPSRSRVRLPPPSGERAAVECFTVGKYALCILGSTIILTKATQIENIMLRPIPLELFIAATLHAFGDGGKSQHAQSTASRPAPSRLWADGEPARFIPENIGFGDASLLRVVAKPSLPGL